VKKGSTSSQAVAPPHPRPCSWPIRRSSRCAGLPPRAVKDQAAYRLVVDRRRDDAGCARRASGRETQSIRAYERQGRRSAKSGKAEKRKTRRLSRQRATQGERKGALAYKGEDAAHHIGRHGSRRGRAACFRELDRQYDWSSVEPAPPTARRRVPRTVA
jgi:hypothetical protein